MKRYGPQGSISVFLSCVLLTLIVFTCTIVDTTRIHVGKIQAAAALQLASESILASYDSQLQSQYGIFAKDILSEQTLLSDLNRYTQSSLNPTTLTTSNTFYDLVHPIRPGFSLYAFDVGEMALLSHQSLVNPSEVKAQILDYMMYRAPYTALAPFLEKTGMIRKTSKTAEIIGQKNAVLSEIETLAVGFYTLEMLIDGIEIDGAYGSPIIDSQGTPLIYPNYVKKLFTEDAYTLPIYTAKDIPLSIYQTALNQNLNFIDETIKQYQTALTESGTLFTELVRNQLSLQKLQAAMDSSASSSANILQQIDALIRSAEADENTDAISQLENILYELQSSYNQLSSQYTAMEQTFAANTSRFNALDTAIYNTYLPEIQKLIAPYVDLKAEYGLIGIIEAAISEIELIQSKTPEVSAQIAAFKETLSQVGDTVIEGTPEKLQTEIDDCSKILGLNEDGSMDVVNNLAVIKDVLQENLMVLSGLSAPISGLSGSRSALQAYWMNQNKSLISESLLNEIGQSLHFTFENPSITTTDYQIIQQLSNIETELDSYSRNLIFDYSGMEATLAQPFQYDDFVDATKEMFPGVEMPDLDINVINVDLPSTMTTQPDDTPYEVTGAIDIATSTNYLELLNALGSGITEDLTELKDDVYVNEYIMGMFLSAADKGVDKDGKTKAPLTLSHFPKSEHLLNYEVEYVLYGNKLDATNLLESVAVIFGIRIALNLIALLLDFDRMNTIRTVADAVAGWWTLGIGSILVTSVLTLMWAMLESVSDVQKLLKGEGVPIIKNADTWQTDPFTGLTNGTKTALDEEKDNNYMPALKYCDYLRLLLLSNKVDEETKYLRLLDLIQMNISHERNEPIKLSNYATGIEVESKIGINSLFFKLPFMPERGKQYGTFTFNFTAKSSY